MSDDQHFLRIMLLQGPARILPQGVQSLNCIDLLDPPIDIRVPVIRERRNADHGRFKKFSLFANPLRIFSSFLWLDRPRTCSSASLTGYLMTRKTLSSQSRVLSVLPTSVG